MRHDKLIRAETKAVLAAEGCQDVDVALQFVNVSGVKITATGDVDAESVKATVKAFKESKAYLFPAMSTAKAEPKSALEMTPQEYEAAKRAFKLGEQSAPGTSRTQRPVVDLGTKDARDMTVEEYEVVRRKLGGGLSFARFGNPAPKPSKKPEAKTESYAAKWMKNWGPKPYR